MSRGNREDPDQTLRTYECVSRDFYERDPVAVAPELLGKLLVRRLGSSVLCGRIVETEAYRSDDSASHTFRGQTERNRAMFGPSGHAYIYFIHGLHHCINVTAHAETPAGGVLIRALEPVAGLEVMQKLRGRTELRDLASGPAKLAQALAIDKALYGIDMTVEGELYIAEQRGDQAKVQPFTCDGNEILATPRIGISHAKEKPWRFIIAGSRFLSR